MQIVESVESTPDLEAREERRCSGQRALVGHGLDMEDLGVVGDGRSWQEPTLAPAPEEHRPWLLRSSDPGELLRSTDPGS